MAFAIIRRVFFGALIYMMLDSALFWLLLRYAEAVHAHDPFAAPPPPRTPPAYMQDCLRKSGNPEGALESCAFLAMTQLDGDIEQRHLRHSNDADWQDSLQRFRDFRAARCRLERETPDELLCRVRLSQQYLEGLPRVP